MFYCLYCWVNARKVLNQFVFGLLVFRGKRRNQEIGGFSKEMGKVGFIIE